MSNSAYEHQIQNLRKPSRCAVIALATAALEKVLAAAKRHPEVDSLLCSLLGDLWRWQSEEKVRGKADMSREEARELPSTRLYDTYEARLLALAAEYSDRGKVYHLIGAMIALLGFTVWLMDGLERQMNPGKPFVFRNDILEVDWETLVAGLATAVEASWTSPVLRSARRASCLSNPRTASRHAMHLAHRELLPRQLIPVHRAEARVAVAVRVLLPSLHVQQLQRHPALLPFGADLHRVGRGPVALPRCARWAVQPFLKRFVAQRLHLGPGA